MNNKTPVSIILVARNEEANVEACLKSVEWAKEIIVVDGQSTDRTAELARKFTSKVFVKENGPCEIQRLYGLQHVMEPWFFLIDADERVSPELAESIRRVVTDNSQNAAYNVLRRNYLDGRKNPVYFNHPEYQLRLFRKSDLIALPEKIHRLPEVRGPIGEIPGELTHYFFGSMTQYLNKINFYTDKESQYLLQDPNFHIKGFRGFLRLVFRPLGRFIEYYFVKRAFLDGYWGLVFSAGAGYYEMLINLKVLMGQDERERNRK